MRHLFLTVFWVCLVGMNTLMAASPTPRGETGQDVPISFEHYGQEKGLSQGTGYAITQFDGYMWFATQDGLNRFDGYEFKVFRPGGQHGLNNGIVQALLADSHGRFWVGTGGGLNLYDKVNERFDRVSRITGIRNALDSVLVERLIEDKRGNIWVMTHEKGLFCLNPDTHKIRRYFSHDNSLYGVCLDPGGTLWISAHHTIYRYDPAGDAFRPVITQQQLATQSLLGSIVFDNRGDLWIGTLEDGVFVLPQSGNRPVIHHQFGTTEKSLSCREITTLLRDRRGRIWVGSRTGGLSIYEPATQTFSHLRHLPNNARSLAENNVWSLYEDRSGIVWVGFSSHGIDKYDPSRFSFHLIQRDVDKPAHSLPDNMIFRLFGQDDALFIGTETGGLAQYSWTTSRVSALPGSLPATKRPPVRGEPGTVTGNEVRVIVADTDKKLWLANWRELIRYDPIRNTVDSYKTPEDREQRYVYAAHLVPDDDGQTTEVWTGGESGLARFDVVTKQWKSWDELPVIKAIARYTIRLMYADLKQNLWLGTLGHGLIRYNISTRTVTRFDATNGLACANIRSLLADGSTLWVGTDCGLFRIDLLDFRVRQHFSDQSVRAAFQLPNNVIYGILKDNQGFLWLSSNKGLTRFSPSMGVLKNYDLSDGLPSDEFNTNVCYRHPDGTLFFGGINGITFFQPDELRKNDVVPPVRITSVMVLDSIYAPGQTRLMLGPDQNFITFTFAALNFSNTAKNQYQYKLEGIDPDWVPARQRRVANYTKLPPGEYVFRVKGSNDDRVWNEQGASMIIVIDPPFWATWWFRLVLVVLLLGGLYGIYQYRIAQLKRRQAHELVVSIRTQELERQRFARELHDGVGANLAVLKLYLSSLGAPGTPVDDLKIRSLAVLKASIDDIRNIIRDVHPRSLSELGLVQTVTDMVALLNENYAVDVTVEAGNVPQKLPENVEINLFRVVQELLQNAMKHANASSVWLYLQYETNTLRLTYRDNGRGFNPVSTGRSAGNGLINIKQRIALLNGTHHLRSAEGEGTTVEISVPVVDS